MVIIIECPRDAMQGIKDFIPTKVKIDYINTLLEVGFQRLDVGSFVSPKAIPQMKDSQLILEAIHLDTPTELLVIVPNQKGCEKACEFEQITYLGYPHSISNEFLKRNTKSNIKESLNRIGEIQNLALQKNKQTLVYLSMGFGNPYGEPYHQDMILEQIDNLYHKFEIRHISISDTIGCGLSKDIHRLCKQLPQYEDLQYTFHLHSSPHLQKEKIQTLIDNNFMVLDGALNGIGGCPYAKDELIGNIATETIFEIFKQNGISTNICEEKLQIARLKSEQIFNTYH